MKKEEVTILAKKQNAEKEVKGYLLHLKNNEYFPFVVCSYYKELEGNRITWDWGHYFCTLEDAYNFFNQDDILHLQEKIKNEVYKIIDMLDELEKETGNKSDFKDIKKALYNTYEKEEEIEKNIEKTFKKYFIDKEEE